MGQQQLLLLVLGTVIVGLGVVAGIDAFNSNQRASDQDALVNQAVQVASDVQAWSQKPAAYGGGGGFANADFSTLDWQALGYETDTDGEYSTQYGDLTLDTSGDDPAVVASSDDYPTEVTVTIAGASSNDITTDIAQN